MQLDSNSLIMQWNTDINGNPVSKHIAREVQQISPTHNLIQLTQIPDEFYPLRIVTEDNVELKEVKYRNDVTETTFCVDYGMGLVYFDKSLSGKFVIINYYGRGVMLISDSRIFHKNGDTIADTWDNIIERSQDALDLIEHAGGLAGAIKIIDQKVEEGTQVADRLEEFITETQFYGYTITLSREAFVVKADDNGEVGKTETSSVYTDVVVYKGAKQIIPTLTISNEYGCAFKVVGQRVTLTSIDVNLIKVNAVLNIDCGDGLVAQRVLEVTKVFDGVNQYQVSMTNPFYSFQANSEGYIEEDQSVECGLKVSKANIDYENYTVQIQNLPQGLNYQINKGSVVFTAISGRLLPSSGSCSVVLTIDGQSFNKPFTWNKTNKGQDAKSLTLVGNQIVRYEKPDYSDIPLQTNTTVSAKVVGLSGTPTWSFYNGVEWKVLENETAMDLTFAYNDQLIWADRKEVTIKCELDGYYDELTIVKLANGSNGNDAITVILTNESHTVAIDDSGYVESSEIENARTNVLAYKGANSVTPKVTKGKCVGCDISIAGNTVQLISLDNSFTSSTAELLVEVDGMTITKVWTISKSKQGLQGQNGQNGKSYILNVTGGSRSITYSQINHDPRPSLSSTFNGALYEDGVEIVEGVSWYWIANGHFEGSSIDSNFTPTIKKVFDESVINNSISVMATYNGQTLTQDIPLSVTKDAYGLDWVQEWDSTKVDVRGNLILTPKIFAGHYDQENDLITGVAIGQDVLNNGRTIGVVGYQNNIPSFLLDTDGSLQVGNPFDENSTGLYYSDGVFKLKVNELSIEGSKVPTESEIGNLVTTEVNSAKNELQETINGLNNSLGSLEDVVNNSLQDGILTEVEKQSLKTVMDTINGEVNTVVSQSNSVLINPYLSNTTLMLKLEELLENYETTHNTLVETYVRITNSDTPTDEDIASFNTTLSDLRVVSDELNQVLIDCLTDISQTQAQQLVDKAKEEIQAEVSDVNDALTDLENTINGDFKAGLVTSINIANLENQLQQLAKEKADLDSQYNVIYNNANLSNTVKSKLVKAKSDYDIAHDTLVAKINSAIADNLMTEQELQEINNLILAYTEKLGIYSGVAQEANVDIALKSAQAVVEALDQEAIFNKLTNNGETQGIYLENGKVYINGEYVNTRNLKAVKNDGTETFKIDSEGNVSIKAKSFTLTGDATTNVATTEYVNSAIEGVINNNINFSTSNEFQIIPTNATYYPFETQSYVVQIYGYKGSEEITDFTIGSVVSTNAIVSVVNNVNRTVTFSVSPNTSLGATHGYIDIPITYEGKSYNKRWSWSVAKEGDQAPQINITGEQVFKYTNNFSGTPTPSSITLTANIYNTSATGKWQYLNGSSWVDCNVTTKTLTLQPASYTLSSLKRVTVRYIIEEVFDTFTVVSVSDGANGQNGSSGADGKGIKTITNRYLATSLASGVTTSTSGWTTSIQTMTTTNKYLWNYETITYTDNSSTTTTPIIIGVHGATGANGSNGSNGVGISSIVEYYLATSSSSGVTTGTAGWTTTIQNPTSSKKYLWNYEVINYTNSTKYTGTPRIIGNYAEDGQDGVNGSDAITIVLTNENHTFSANSSGNITSAQSTSTNITAYKGANTTSVTIGTLPTVTGLTLSKSGSTVTVQANTGTSLADTGTFSIPLTIDGKSFTKNFSWTKVKAGATGATGTSAKAVDIIASSQVFKSTDGGTTFSPSTITLTPKLQNLTYSNWQYSTNGGSSWTTVTSGSNGLTISSGVLTISKNSALYTSSVTSVAFRVNTNDSAYYDVVTIVKLYDVGDLEIGGRNLALGSKTATKDLASGGGTSLTVTDLFGGVTAIKTNTAWSGRYFNLKAIAQRGGFKVGDNLVLSVYIKADQNVTLNVTSHRTTSTGNTAGSSKAYNNFTVTPKWQQVWFPFVADEGTLNRVDARIEVNVATGTNYIYWAGWKLEKGTVATEYTEAPEDVSQEITDKVNNYDTSLNQLKVFNKLTNNGQTQGIYLENNKLYINGEYIKGKSIAADKLEANVLSANNIVSIINGGSTTISGNKITTGSITADKMAIGVDGGYSRNADLSKWSSTYPDGTQSWSSSAISKVSVDGKYVAQFSNTTASTQTGMQLTKSFFSDGVNLSGVQYICIEAKVRVTTGNFNGSCILMDIYRTDGTYERLQLPFNELGTPVANQWYTHRKIFKLSDTNVRKTFRDVSGYALANWSSGGGGNSTKTMQFAYINFYRATHQDYLTQTWTTGTQINGANIKTGTLSANVITSGTFQGTNFIAGGSTNGNGYMEVRDSSNNSTFYANKSGVKAKEIQFIENPKNNDTGINTVLDKTGMNTYYAETDGSFINRTKYNYYGIELNRQDLGTNATVTAKSEITTFGGYYKRVGTGSQADYTGEVLFGLTSSKSGDPFHIPSITYKKSNTGFRIATSSDVTTRNHSASWTGTGTMLEIDTSGSTNVRKLQVVDSSGNKKNAAKPNSSGGVDLGDSTSKTAILSNVVPSWWNGSASYDLFTNGNCTIKSGGSGGTSYRFPNGLQINTMQIYGTWNITTAWGSVYSSPYITPGNYTEAFLTPPQVSITAHGAGTAIMVCQAGAPTTTTPGSYYLWKPVQQTGVKDYIEIISIGRWK